MIDEFNRHYITVDDRNRIVNGFSDAFRQPAEADICINENAGYQFRLFPDGVENPPLFKMPERIPQYKWEYGAVKNRSAEEIEADIANLPAPGPSQIDVIEAQVTYTAMMTDTLLEV